MEHAILENYIEKVYGYAVNRTYSREEADELDRKSTRLNSSHIH